MGLGVLAPDVDAVGSGFELHVGQALKARHEALAVPQLFDLGLAERGLLDAALDVDARLDFVSLEPIKARGGDLDQEALVHRGGPFQFRDAKLSLAAPASGTLKGDTVTFAPGALRFTVTAAVLLNGVKMFGGIPLTAEYGNSSPATAIRGIDGSFHFVDATFTVGEYTAVLNTQPSILVSIQ
jgi:hypothetical protein